MFRAYPVFAGVSFCKANGDGKLFAPLCRVIFGDVLDLLWPFFGRTQNMNINFEYLIYYLGNLRLLSEIL